MPFSISSWRLWGRLLDNFGSQNRIFGPFRDAFSSQNCPLGLLGGGLLGSILGPKTVPFEVHLGSNFDIEIYKKSCCFLVAFPGGVLGLPGHPPKLKPLILRGALFKIEGGPFCSWELPGSILESKINPKRSPKATKMSTRTRSEDRCENGRENISKQFKID